MLKRYELYTPSPRYARPSVTYLGVDMYRLSHEVEVSTWLTHRGPEAQGCVTHIGTDTEWYNRLVPWATWPWQHIYGLATIAWSIKGSNVYLATVQTIVDHHLSSLTLDIDDSESTCFFLWLLPWHSEPHYHHCVQKAGHCVGLVSISTRSRQLCTAVLL